MLPSMYAPTEHEIYPPDVCYSREVSHPTGWNQTNDLVLSNNNEHGTVENVNMFDDANQSLHNVDDDHSSNNENLEINDCLEGAVGGMLPDLCVNVVSNINVPTTCKSNTLSSNENILSCHDSDKSGCELIEEKIQILENFNLEGTPINSMQDTNEGSELENISLSPQNACLECEDVSIITRNDEYLIHNYKQINLVSCGIGDVQQECDFNVNNDEKLSVVYSESHLSLCCDKLGALDKLCDLRTYGFDLVRQNLIQSSDPSYYKWECSAVIPSYLLPPFSLQSHGTSLDSGTSYILNFPVSRPSVNDSEPQLTEEEQIKMAKRSGLITHLPCGIFDGSAKHRECVICMIDFSDGDKVRYLPCMHTYHTACIDDWLMRSFTCPSCLEPVDAALLNTYETS